MRSNWLLDKWEERFAREDDPHKAGETFAVGASLAFPSFVPDLSLEEFVRSVSSQSPSGYSLFDLPVANHQHVQFENGFLTFRSTVTTETPANNIVCARVCESDQRRSAIIILPHWNAAIWSYRRIAGFLARLGVTVVEMTLPYQGNRKREGTVVADYLLGANLGRTIRSFGQAVVDTRSVIDWLVGRGYRNIGLAGISIGSCVANLVAAHDARVRSSALLLTAGDFAEVVWTGCATQHVRRALEGRITLEQLRTVWSVVSPSSYIDRLSRPGYKTVIISGNRDCVVKPHLTERFVEQLRARNADVKWIKLWCGHYSLALCPFNFITLIGLIRFLRETDLISPPKNSVWKPCTAAALRQTKARLENSVFDGRDKARASLGLQPETARE